MPRRPRSFAEGLYHVIPQASDDRFLFLTDESRRTFLERLASTFRQFELGLVTYTLMGTHYHLVLLTPGDRVSAALQRLHTWYARRHNKVHRRNAHLFRSHFYAREITSDEDLLAVCRYVAWNPVEAGLVRRPWAWSWSSAAANAGLRRSSVPLYEAPLRAACGDGPGWRRRYRDLIEAPEDLGNASQPG